MFRVRLAVQGVYKRNYVSDSPPNIKNSVMTLPKYRRYLKPVDPKLEEKYASARVEQGWSREWAEAESRESDKLSLFENDNYGNNKHNLFRMVLPPPNITGDLHLGHAITVAIEDAICRYRRLNGDQVIWIPGTDHAGIATQAVLDRKIAREAELNSQPSANQNSHWSTKDVEYRLKVAENWKLQKEDRIFEQLARMGASLSWSRKLFTMDEKMSACVNEAFVRLYQHGFIYRNKRLVNWCTKLQTTLSDIEVDYIDVQPNQKLDGVNMGCMHNFAYPIYQGGNTGGSNGDDNGRGEVIVSTGRLETMLADVAIAVHPEDKRYSHLEHLKTLLEHPLTGRKLILIKDSEVDINSGTGAMKVTPAYSKIDYEMCQRHGVSDFVECFDDRGRLTLEGFQGYNRATATDKIKAKLEERGLYRGSKAVTRSIPICSRTGTLVDQRLRPQWYLKCDDLAQRALEEVESGRVSMVPAYHAKIWKDWMSKPQDWCISRQLWWGHRIPAYRLPSSADNSKASWIVTTDDRSVPPGAERDTDVLDTWFSSALYPLVAFGWPKVSRPPTLNLMETGHDILKFWVARMMIVSLALTDRPPFKKIVLHGLLRDSKGQKMSKSLGNVIDPLHIVEGASPEQLYKETEKLFAKGYLNEKEKNRAHQQTSRLFPKGVLPHGADALRLALLSCDVYMENVSFDVQRVITARNFCNKIWQGVRFYTQAIMTNVSESKKHLEPFDVSASATLDEFDKWILARLHSTQDTVKKSFETFTSQIAVNELEKFWITGLCDVYLEVIKPDVWNSTSCFPRRISVLREVIRTFLIIASPFLPHLTEELHHKLQLMAGLSREECTSIHAQQWPSTRQWHNDDVVHDVAKFLDSLSQVRMTKQRKGLPQAVKILSELRLNEKRRKIACLLCKIKPDQVGESKQML
ncbi:valine--tRNA ligase, mitochondrial 1-like isoform X1 [Varroa destructor]|uniref:valine--tRNA ligase n=1 Tax=Varroa destructor TaxID=109461 RepID=A0A7M7KED1_VARDE|nr:valine--tRNA ligase, mitochondrial 1-like isoform X1 [Varroa destructor]XP_022664968.1 valine--tRNA ligase, mitochondrial 1-like isoform X1 [Varroa destructor]XP_022664969.1 valine--tRNA ligase, mitochondrial 1-like isoform X1 [Varroa destructor]